jgi:hypothetical protein
MKNNGNASNLGEEKTVDRKITPDLLLRNGQGKALSPPLEKRKIGVLAVFPAPEKRPKGQIHPDDHALKRPGRDLPPDLDGSFFEDGSVPSCPYSEKPAPYQSRKSLRYSKNGYYRTSGILPSIGSETFPVFRSDPAGT